MARAQSDPSSASACIHPWAPLVGGIPAKGIARWDGQRWSPFGPVLTAPVRACAVFDDGRGPALYAAGEFTLIGGHATQHIARWNGTAWEP
jgi:hypothetical protein